MAANWGGFYITAIAIAILYPLSLELFEQLLKPVTSASTNGSCELALGAENHTAIPEKEIDGIIAAIREQERTKSERLVHPKMHACVRGEFVAFSTIRLTKNGLPSSSQVGLFGSGPKKVLPALVRFSNGAERRKADRSADVRGMAIKIMDVEGPRAFSDELKLENSVQDIVMISSDIFFVSAPSNYPTLFHAIDGLKQPLFGGFFGSLWDLLETGGTSLLGTVMKLNLRGWKMNNPLDFIYNSAVPYKSGDTAMKWEVRPCYRQDENGKSEAYVPGWIEWLSNPNVLRTAVEKTLIEKDWCFDVFVQLQRDACSQPVEDATVSWGRQGFVHVGKLTMSRQNVTLQDEECDQRSWNPWHSLKVHRPLGGINEVRKRVYSAAAQRRIK